MADAPRILICGVGTSLGRAMARALMQAGIAASAATDAPTVPTVSPWAPPRRADNEPWYRRHAKPARR